MFVLLFQDGFYDGRNLEGRYGLIPSNFIEPIMNPNELPETVRHIIQRLTGKIFSSKPKNKYFPLVFIHIFFCIDEINSPRRDQPSNINFDALNNSNTCIDFPPTYRKQCKNKY
jgi:hypothetical protein